MDEYRIVLLSDDREYFHISCLEKMIRLPSLVPSRFKLDTEYYRWNVDLAKIAEYIDAYDTFQRANGDFSTQHVEWQLTHLRECSRLSRRRESFYSGVRVLVFFGLSLFRAQC
jgi:hypothetical protein